MRLTQKQILAIKKNFQKYFHSGDIYLFGSRVNDVKKGGDIDLYIVTDNKDNLALKKIKFLANLKREIGEQKIDIVLNYDNNRTIEIEAQNKGIKL